MFNKLRLILIIIICSIFIYAIIKQIFFINNLKNNGLHSEAKVYDRCIPSCILVDLKDSQVTHSDFKVNVFLPTNYKPGDWVNIIYDKNDKKKIIVDDAIQTIYFPYGILSFLLITLTFFIR